MVLRDSKHDKVTISSPVTTPAADKNTMSSNTKNFRYSDNFTNSENQKSSISPPDLSSVLAISNETDGQHFVPSFHRDISIEISRASTSSELENIIDSNTDSDRQTPDSLDSTLSVPSPSVTAKNRLEKTRSMMLQTPEPTDSAQVNNHRWREKSPMEGKRMLEKNWQTTFTELDEIISAASAPYKGHLNENEFVRNFGAKDVLHLLYKLFDWDCVGRVEQEKLVDFARRALTCHGGRELVELLEVLAYVICEGDDGDIRKEHFVKIFSSRGVLVKLFKYINKEGDGHVSRQEIMDLLANLTYARPHKDLNKDSLDWLEKIFKEALGSKQELTFDDFKKIVHSKNSFFAERVFEIFDRDKSGSVSLSEFLDAVHQFTGKSPNDKIQFLFRVYDLDGDGLIQQEELEQVMKACMEENGMKFSVEQIEDLTLALFEDADTEERGAITFEALKAQLEKHPGLLENLSISIDRWLVPPEPEKRASMVENLKNLRPYQLTFPYWRNNYVYLIFLFCYIIVNLGLFIDRAKTVYDDGGNIYYILARACGQCLNFNCAFILVLMLRQSITFLRSRGVSSFLPLDNHIYLHKLVGFVIFFYSLLHTVMHLINFPLFVVPSDIREFSTFQWLFTAEPETFGLIDGWANPTGFILVVVLVIMVVCSLPFVRKSGYFEVFYWTHLLYVAFWVLTILHGPSFWKWFIGPAVLFLIEKVYRTIRIKTGHGKTYISSGILLPSKVIHLIIQKPYSFNYCPGDYVFVNIPTIAKYEWHPLTISSAPEQDGAIWLHIRAVGEWTNTLYKYFETQQLQCERRTTIITTTNTDVQIPIELERETNKAIENGDTRESGARKNGVINVSFDNSGTDEITLNNIVEEPEVNGTDTPKKFPRTKKLKKTTSVSDLDINGHKKKSMFNENSRTNSEASMDSKTLERAKRLARQKSINEDSKILFKTNLSAAKSVKYMRRKPKVITLDIPAEDSGTEGTTKNPASEGQGNDLIVQIPTDDETPKNTAVRRGSGRLSQIRKISQVVGINQPKKSFRESENQVARRLSRMKEAASLGTCTIGKPLAIYIDGPYGAPSSHIFRAQHAVLIATGIGVTPFASILQSIMHRYLKARQSCPNCDHSWTSDIPQSVMNLRKVDFFWINRDQRSFEWFVNLLSQLEIEQAEQGGVLDRFLDMHMYITSALQRTDMKAVGLQLALELLHEKEKRDLITGLKTRTIAGRPNWDKVFKQLTKQKKGKITVFYCGPPALGRTLRYKCDEYGFDFKKEIF